MRVSGVGGFGEGPRAGTGWADAVLTHRGLTSRARGRKVQRVEAVAAGTAIRQAVFGVPNPVDCCVGPAVADTNH